MGLEGNDWHLESMHSGEGRLNVEILSDPKSLREHEIERVLWYLKRLPTYRKLGYDSIMRFPPGIDVGDTEKLSRENLRTFIEKDMSANWVDYATYAHEIEKTFTLLMNRVRKVVSVIYGFSPQGNFVLAPTAYGTGGGALEKGGVIFFKLPTFRPKGRRRTEVEVLTHEILAHEITAQLREGTAIDNAIETSHRWHMEYLMDLLGRTILVRGGLMRRDDVVMDDYAEGQARELIDPLYYSDPRHPDEYQLRYEGRLPDLVKAIDTKLRQGIKKVT